MFCKHGALQSFVQAHAVVQGNVTLSSGLRSDYYIDGKSILSSPEGLSLVAEAILAELENYEVYAIGGLEIGAISIAAAVSMMSKDKPRPLPNFFVRKDAKKHGSMKQIEGFLPEGKPVAIVDDVITTGGSVIKAIDAVKEVGCQVPVAIAIVDREAGAREALESRHIEFCPLMSISNLGLSNGRSNQMPVPANSR